MHRARRRTVDGSTIICIGAAERRVVQAGPRHERCTERDSGSGRSDVAPIDDGENAKAVDAAPASSASVVCILCMTDLISGLALQLELCSWQKLLLGSEPFSSFTARSLVHLKSGNQI